MRTSFFPQCRPGARTWIAVGFAVVAATLSVPGALPIQRVPNTTLQMPQTPPVFGYAVTNAFGTLTFTAPVAITSPPGETNRLFIVEQGGRIAVITNLAVPNRSVFLDVSSKIIGGVPSNEQGLLGLAFHPGYATNGFFYIYYVGNATTSAAANAPHDILARYQVSPGNPNQAQSASEVRLIVQYDEASNHNGGDLHFGPDGYLYVSLGDEGGSNGQYNNTQRIDKDFFSAFLRLDVDKRPGNLPPNSHPASTANYSVPSDNPYVGATSFNGNTVNPANVRTEFWAVGMRNPYRYSFDSETGFLYCGDVGQGVYEEVDIIKRGGNYGWNYREGLHAGPTTAPGGFTSLNPIQEYVHGAGSSQGYCVIGGVVYRGDRVEQLSGAYIFGDYVTGNIWMLRYDGTNTTPFQRIVAGELGVAAYGIDPRNGDVLMASQGLNRIRRLIYATNFTGTAIPPTLADTGVFASPTALTPNAGIVPFDVNVGFWSDNAQKTRWFSVPATNQTIGFNADGNWTFPAGTVWIKHMELQLTNGVPGSMRRLETRLLIKNDADFGIYGVTYRWGGSLTNATLVAEEGLDETFVINDGSGGLRSQVWHYPGRAECIICHTKVGGFALGFNTPQLNRDFNYIGTPSNQIAALHLAGYFSGSVTNIHTLRALADSADASVSLEYRVRSYVAANCVQCHQPGPGGVPASLWDARIETPGPLTGIINGALVDDGGNPNSRVIKPGSLANSTLFNRLLTLGPDHMPPLATSLINPQAVALLGAWTTNSLATYQSFADWQIARFGATNAPNAGLYADFDGDGAVNYVEYLTDTDPLQATNFWRIGIMTTNPGAVLITYPQIANRGFEVQYSTAPLNSTAWSRLDVPGNQPFFSGSNRPALIKDVISPNAARSYRVRVYEP